MYLNELENDNLPNTEETSIAPYLFCTGLILDLGT